MPDTDPTTEQSSTAGAPGDTPADAPPAKAPRKRVTKAAADGEAPKKAPRKRAPRKVAAPAAEPSPEDPPVLEAQAEGEPVAAAVEDDPTTAAARERSKPATRARKAPATVAFQAPTADADAETEEPAPAPRRRRRAGTAGAVSPTELVPTLIEPVVAASDDVDDEAGASDGDQPEAEDGDRPRRRRRGRRGRGRRPDGERDDTDDEETDDATPAVPGDETSEHSDDSDDEDSDEDSDEDDEEGDEDGATSGTRRRRRRRRRPGGTGGGDAGDDVAATSTREGRSSRVRGAGAADEDGVRGISGSTRMAAKRVRRQEGRDSGRRRQPILSEAEFLARRESVERDMVIRQKGDRTQIAVLEDGVLVEHYVTRTSAQSFAGNVYLGRVQNVLPSMEAAFVDIGKGRNAVLYAGEVNWAGVGGGQRKIEQALSSGSEVLVQVSKDPMGHKGARLTGQVSLPGRYLVYVPEGSMTGISRKLPDKERDRLKKILQSVVPKEAGVIIRTAAEGASEEEIAADVRRLQAQWEVIQTKAEQGGGPKLLHAEPDLVIRVIRDVFNEDFRTLVVQGDSEWETIRDYVEFVAPDLAPRLKRFTAEGDVFTEHRVDEQLAKALDRKVWLPSGGSLVIDRTEAMVVIDVNTGKYVGKGGNLEETVTRNNLEAAEEIARQLRLRDLGGIIVVDFIDMVLESNRDLVVRRLVECMARDRTKHQVAEVTSLGLVQMTRKRVGQGLLESFSEPCDACNGRGVLVRSEPIDAPRGGGAGEGERSGRGSRRPKKDDATPALAAKKADDSRPRAAVADDDAGPGEDGGERPRRRRRSGRAAAAAAVRPEDELAELLAPTEQDAAHPHTAEQPTAAEEDLPVLPPVLASVADPEPVEPEAEAAPVVVADSPDAPATEPTTEPTAEPTDAAAEASPRRRRRATSRPAGPPVVE